MEIHEVNALFVERPTARIGFGKNLDFRAAFTGDAPQAGSILRDFTVIQHAEELKRNPSEWMPWNYRETLARLASPPPRNNMIPSWPKRIDCVRRNGHRQVPEKRPSAKQNRRGP